MSSLPLGDWQFWAATLVALGAFGAVVRPLLARRSKAGPCPGCPSGAASRRALRQGTPTTLTVGGKRVR
ncbi:MAG: hypothetical protein U0572_11680 [Phycisphaerales bacterium]